MQAAFLRIELSDWSLLPLILNYPKPGLWQNTHPFGPLDVRFSPIQR